MDSLVLIVPGRLEILTGGYGYDRRIVAGLRARGRPVAVRELHDSFPHPTSAALDQAARAFAAIPDGRTVLIDGLALGAMPAQVSRESTRLRLIGLVHHPLAAETGLDGDTIARLMASERQALAAVRLVVVTSRATATALASYGVSQERIAIVEPGTDPAPLAIGSEGTFLQLLSVAALIPRKGHDILFRALATIPNLNWRLTCVGSVERDPPTVERLRARLRADGLEDRVQLAGEMDGDRLASHYNRADLFVLPTRYEGYGMAVAEALARGLPVVATAAGAIPDLVSDDAGLLVPPGDSNALAAALSHVLGDARVRERLAEGARRARARLPSWKDASGKMAKVLERVATDAQFQR